MTSSPHERNLRGRLLSLLTLLFLAGCVTVGPDYKKPELELAPQWHHTEDPALLPQAELVQAWWVLFEDPLLDRLVAEAAQNNRDLLTAVARVAETRALLGFARGERLPAAEGGAEVQRIRTSENSGADLGVETLYAHALTASWEIDLFGRIRRSVEAAHAEYQATEEERTDVMITLFSTVSLTYLDIRTNQARLAAAQANIEAQKALLDLVQVRVDHGLATHLDLAQAQRLLAHAQAQVPPLRLAVSQGVNNLAVLLGRQPGALSQEILNPRPIPLPPPKVTLGVPADLLRQRPDIRRAERMLAAQTARIGVAKAALYPSFSLVGSFGNESFDASNLLDAGSRTLSFGPSLRWNIFSGGRIRNQIKARDALTQQALFTYEQSVLNGLREVENALEAYTEGRIRLGALERSVTAAQESVRLATDLYTQGLIDFQPILDARRDQLDFENQLAAARGDCAANFVRLYAALGGGWDPNQTTHTANQGASHP
ncbi:Efflux transporter outer membrane subunit [Sulfidibacter corallicola]|uniref:Efflux transporter outer membrane subunit n=1 Tax=Sulfidibacter corallicola TaxID=2818388 RepID=A0A8A4TNG3_SULCO|nr:efflux transporter outer membrane subunit [Sulfidibacter corallicola]QTD50642.1 efflux transporter outer membrane subunit [Sulfidibacter corallicola]